MGEAHTHPSFHTNLNTRNHLSRNLPILQNTSQSFSLLLHFGFGPSESFTHLTKRNILAGALSPDATGPLFALLLVPLCNCLYLLRKGFDRLTGCEVDSGRSPCSVWSRFFFSLGGAILLFVTDLCSSSSCR